MLVDFDRVLRGRRTRALAISITAGVVAVLCISAVAWAFAARRPTGWEAEARVVVLPAGRPGQPAETGYYESLSRGQIVGTFAEMLQLDRFEAGVADGLSLTPEERQSVEVRATVIPDSAMITVTASAPDRVTAETMADAVILSSSDELATFAEPYTLELVSSASGQGRQVGLPGLEYGLIMTVVALVGGIAVQQAVHQLLAALDPDASGDGVAESGRRAERPERERRRVAQTALRRRR
jgi:capsular polysaccharide biosynthesis protein